MTSHPFDLKVDQVYDVDSNPNVYLSDAQVESACASISCESPKDEAARDCIIKIESAQRERCLGNIPNSEYDHVSRSVNESFRAKFGTWVYQSAFSRKFYAKFGVEAV